MKICAIICEFNPFHNGHEYLISKVKELSGCDSVLCIMSGSFTQRGDIAVADKFIRAKHAILGGADCVIELPTPFAVAPAEIFARGAVKILSSIPAVECLAFGCEKLNDFLSIASRLTAANDDFKTALKRRMNSGAGYAKSYAEAYSECGGGSELFTPNNILSIEYAKSVLACRKAIRLIPIERKGSGYNDGELKDNFSSASAIRANLNNKNVSNNVPNYVFDDLQSITCDINMWKIVIQYALLSASKEKLRDIFGCTEGLENKLIRLADKPFDTIVSEATCKRYSSTRIRRILTANALNLSEKKTKAFLSDAGYVKPLAVKNELTDEILAELSKSAYPIIVNQRDLNKLNEASRALFEATIFADNVWSAVNNKSIYNFTLSLI